MNVREPMKADLKAAMKKREKVAIRTLRSLLAAIDNAEAVKVNDTGDPTIHPLGNPMAGRSNDVPRKILTAQDVQQILHKEADEHRAALAEYMRLGREDAAKQLSAEVEIVARYIEDFEDSTP